MRRWTQPPKALAACWLHASYQSTLVLTAACSSRVLTVVVSFVLIPASVRDTVEGPIGLFRFDELLQHNLNIAIVVGEVLLNEIHVSVRDAPYALLFGCAYLVWHQYVRFALTRTLIYFFLVRRATRTHRCGHIEHSYWPAWF